MKFTRQVSFFGECNSTIIKELQLFMANKINLLNLLSRIEVKDRDNGKNVETISLNVRRIKCHVVVYPDKYRFYNLEQDS